MTESALRPLMNDHGVIQMPAYALPTSSLLSEHVARLLLKHESFEAELRETIPPIGRDIGHIADQRKYVDERLMMPLIARLEQLYAVKVTSTNISEVPVEIIESVENKHCLDGTVLLNLHGGGFVVGGRYGGRVESIPLAARGFKIISIDYRMAPEHRYPAATEDVLAVYQDILRTYPSSAIGIYGCSSGAELSAQTLAALVSQGLPVPGAAGMFAGAGCHWAQGDSAHYGAAFTDFPLGPLSEDPYFGAADPSDPLVFPINSDKIMTQFPPCLLGTSTRDFVLSAVVHMHSNLVKLGVTAQLHVWEGLGHAFLYEPDFPQSHEAYDALAAFFRAHLRPS